MIITLEEAKQTRLTTDMKEMIVSGPLKSERYFKVSYDKILMEAM